MSRLYTLGEPARLALAGRVGSRLAPACSACGSSTARMTKSEMAAAGVAGCVRWCTSCRCLSRVIVEDGEADMLGSWIVAPLVVAT